MVPYIVPGIVMGIAFLESFNAGPLSLTGTGTIIVLAILIRSLPYATRAATAALGQLSPSLEQAAVSLGYHPARAFLKVTVPLDHARHRRRRDDELRHRDERTVVLAGALCRQYHDDAGQHLLLVMDGEYGTASALATILLATTGALVYGAFSLSGRDQRALL